MTLEIVTLIVSGLVLLLSIYALYTSRKSYLQTRETVKKLEAMNRDNGEA